jgi:hypothetical protein
VKLVEFLTLGSIGLGCRSRIFSDIKIQKVCDVTSTISYGLEVLFYSHTGVVLFWVDVSGAAEKQDCR